MTIPFLSTNSTNDAATKSGVSSPGGLKVVVLEGSPYDRGVIHGRMLKKEINEVIRKWKTQIEAGYKIDADEFILRFIKETDFIPAIRKWTPDLLEEVKGIAEGAGVDFTTMLFFQFPDEEWANAPSIAAGHCSSMGIDKRGDRPAVIAQNMDIGGFYDGYQTLLCIKRKDSDLESFVFTCAGLIALNGMNNRSVGVTVNTLSQLSHSRDSLPVSFVIRGILERETLKDAVKFLHTVKHASGQNYILGGPEEVFSFECSANRISPYVPFKNAHIVYHTNHPLANDDYSDEYRTWLVTHDRSEIQKSDTGVRFQSLEKRLKGNLDALDVDDFQSALRSTDSEKNPICVPYRNASETFTFGSTIMILSKKPEIWITAGPPDSKEYMAFAFSPGS